MKTPNNLNDLNKMLSENGFESDEYNGKTIYINNIEIGYDSTRELWFFADKKIITKELKQILKDKNKISELINDV
ncbi:MAG: hypothetical protein HKO92_11415 [Flavobacteriaceae bacterium]|nr:hypothetical protein [Flavobacteriaceae bacterium]